MTLNRTITGMTPVYILADGCQEPYRCSLLMFCRANEGFYIADVAHALRRGGGVTKFGGGAMPTFTVSLSRPRAS